MRATRGLIALLGVMLLGASPGSGGADVFAEATAGRQRVITPEYFGIHFHRLAPQANAPEPRTVWPNLQFGSLRLWDAGVRWADVAPRPGQWDYDRMDRYIGEAKAHDASVLYTLGSTPRWASARPDERCPYGMGCAAEPVRLAHWEEYVRRVAIRYRDQISAYELWNEPYFSDLARDRAQPAAFFSGSVADMVAMGRVAREVLDQVSPDAILATPGFVGEPDRLDLFLRNGGKAYVQAVAFHFYTRDPAEFVHRILEVRAVMRRNGVEKLPLWNTELGIEVYPDGAPMPTYVAERLTRRQAAARMVQLLILGAEAGLDRFYYYAWDNEHSGMVTGEGKPLPAYEAMARVQDWLIGARVQGCASPKRGLVVCRAAREGRGYLIAWSDRTASHVVSLPVGENVADVESLMSDSPRPVYSVRPSAIRISLGPEPVRITFK